MEYEKEFFKEKGVKKVKIIAPEIAPEEIGRLEDLDRKTFLDAKTFEVVGKEKIYEWIKKGESIDLKDKFVEGFSLSEYRKNNGMGDSEEVTLKNFNAKETFFDGEAIFSYAVFNGDACFSGSFFGKGVCFHRADFGDGDVNFRCTIFGGGCANFTLATFGKGNVNFRRADFGDGLVDFRMATFGGENIDFSQATFGEGNVFFERANFGRGNVDFSQTSFEKREVSFFDANFERGDVSFKNATFGDGYILFPSLKVQGDWDMRLVRANIIDFSNSLIHGTVNFTGAKINQLKLINTQLTGKIFISSKELKLERVFPVPVICGLVELIRLIPKIQKPDVIRIQGKETTRTEKRNQFRLLKENFHNLGQYEDEDRAYYWLKYYEIRAEAFKLSDGFYSRFEKWFLNKEWNIKRIMGRSPFYKKEVKIEEIKAAIFLLLSYHTMLVGLLLRFADLFIFAYRWLVYEKVGWYGTSPFRVAFSMFVVVFGFFLIYSRLLPPLAGNPSPLFHSVITFLTIGYGANYIDMSIRAAKILSGIEGFIGLFLISYFTISFARKVLR